MHRNTTEGGTGTSWRGRAVDPIGYVPSRAWITKSALENCHWNLQWRSNGSMDSQLNKMLWGTTPREMMQSERSGFLRAPNTAIKTRKKARDVWRYSELCRIFASHVTSPALGKTDEKLMGAWGFDFNRWLSSVTAPSAFHPKVGLQLCLSTGNTNYTNSSLNSGPQWNHTFSQKGMQSPLKFKGWGQPGLLENAAIPGSKWAARGALGAQDTEENQQLRGV